jgi:DNA-directed RNA polymerase specialized sigma24 family protein
VKSKKTKKKKNKLSYEDISEIVEYLVATKAYQNTFDCYESDDIAQEIRIICLKALDHFDMSKVKDNKLVNFFGRCVDNSLKNLKRDKYIRYTPPCDNDCSYLHGDEYLDGDLAKVCKRWIKFKKKIRRQASIKNPISVEHASEPIRAPDFSEMIEAEDLKQYFMRNLDDELKPYFIDILRGDRRDIPVKYRHKIQRAIKKFLKD